MARNTILFNDFVNDYIASRSEEAVDKYASKQAVRIAAKRAYRELNLDAFNRIVSARLAVDSTTNTVVLPNDYIRYTKIGILDDACNVISITLNPDQNIGGALLLDGNGNQLLDADGFPLKDTVLQDCGDVGGDIQDGSYGYVFGNYNYNGFYGRLFGWGGGNNMFGYYRFNNEDNVINLDSSFRYDEIVLEYISDGSMADNPTIPVECEQAMWAGTFYFLIQRMGAPVGLGEKQIAQKEWKNEKRLAKSRRLQPTKNEIVSALYKNFTLSPRITS